MPSDATIVEIIRSRILRGVQLGTLTHGDRLSSTRELAAELQVDHRTVLAAFKTLETEGLVDVRERGGAYVRHDRSKERAPWIPESWFLETFVAGYARELAPAELVEWMGRSIATLRLRAVVIAWDEAELLELEREIHRDFQLEIEGVAASDLADPQRMAVLRRADVLIAMSNVEETVRAIASRVNKPILLVDTKPPLSRNDWIALLRKQLWVVVGSAAFGDLLVRSLQELENASNLRVLVAGRDDLALIPQNAPTYLTQRVRDTLDLAEFKGRILPAPRTLTADSARAILQFVVHANMRAAHAMVLNESRD